MLWNQYRLYSSSISSRISRFKKFKLGRKCRDYTIQYKLLNLWILHLFTFFCSHSLEYPSKLHHLTIPYLSITHEVLKATPILKPSLNSTKKAECQIIDAFEVWCWRRLLRVPWTERKSNQSILKEINSEYSLEGLMLRLKLQYFGHLMRRAY